MMHLMWFALGVAAAVPLYLLRVRGWKRLGAAMAVAFFAALAAIPDRRIKTPVDVAAVPPASPDAGVDADSEKPSTMLAAPTEDEQRAMWDSLHRSGS